MLPYPSGVPVFVTVVLTPKHPLVALQRRRYAFGAKCTFNDREYDAPIADFRPRREPNYELKRMELTTALQVPYFRVSLDSVDASLYPAHPPHHAGWP